MEELRTKHKQVAAHHNIALDCINPQTSHGSPYHVHPFPSPVRLQHAFQAQPSPKMFHPKGLKPHLDSRAYCTPNDSPVLGRALCFTPRGSPLPNRVSHLNDKFQDSLTLNSDTDALVAKISAMFPTVSETHIRILLKKYYNREAVVISALQVEKHPITTPGPLSMSPSAARLHKGALGVYSALQLAKGVSGSLHGSTHTTLTLTPQGSPLLLRPSSGASSYFGTNKSVEFHPVKQQSPKMKLKYLKSVFQKAEETLILDVLANKDNNVQKASEELMSMGFIKKETIINLNKKEKETSIKSAEETKTNLKTPEEKQNLKSKLIKKFDMIAEKVIIMALDSVDYNDERAEQILKAVVQENNLPKNTITFDHKDSRRPDSNEKFGPILKSSKNVETKYKSQYSITNSGPNQLLRQGPKDSILLEEYMTWNGPNPKLRNGQSVKPEGPELRTNSAVSLARGPSSLAKGPAGLAKGSIYQKLNKKSTKIVV
ncbi:uncharacterized protein LOC126978994 isoform X2 [Leptidea sinapis]|uniref:uncharacterized protein LOC126978994 isoform X2 n=1 Tax=Leptidea sinapis TaxID=189913 RepID=UPI0021C4A228|nr:uncharacterized protein LOC126978994 isoform X2 [Leptidea sinapis]